MHFRLRTWGLRTSLTTLALVGASSARPVHAQAGDAGAVSLDWNAPAECGDTASVESEVSRLLGGQPIAPEKRVRARARIERTPDGAWHVDLLTERNGTRGERTLSAASCRAAADATALILALIVDPTQVAAARATPSASPRGATPSPSPAALPSPSRAAGPLPESTASTAATEPPSVLAPAPEPVKSVAAEKVTRNTAPKKERANLVAFGAFGIADIGALPAAAAGFGAFVAWTPGPVRVEARGVDFPSATVQLEDGHRGEFHLAAGALRGCYAVVMRSPFQGSPCAGLEVGTIGGQSSGVATPGSGRSLWAASTFGGLFSYRMAPGLALRLDLDFFVALVRPQFIIDAVGSVHRPSQLGARAALGMEVRF